MATAKNNMEISSESNPPDEIIEEALNHILEEEYEQAYDKLASEMDEKLASTRNSSYRDERVVANVLEPEVAELLSEVVTEAPYYSAGSLENSKNRLENFSQKYLE